MHKLSSCITLACTLLLVAAAARADEPKRTSPPKAPSENEEESIQPEVTIIQREDKTVEEYRINGRLYKIKVTPKVGPPYYLVDRNGDGSFVSVPVGRGLEPDIMIPQWVLFRW
jgi:hypothetical protein